MFKKFKENKYFRYGAIAFIVGALLVGLIFAIIKFSDITSVISGIVDAMSAFVYGFVFAFLINPLYKKYHKHVFKFVEKKKEHPKLRKAFSLILAYITIAAIIALFIWLVVPNIVDNVKTLAEKFPAYVQSIKASLLDILSKIPGVEDPNVTLQQITDYFSSDSSTSDIAGMLGSVATTIIHIVITIGSHAFSIIVGIILSIYFLIYKESIIRRTKRLLCAIFKHPAFQWIAVAALATWLAASLATPIGNAVQRSKHRKKTEELAKLRDEAPKEPAKPTPDSELFLIRQINFRITEQLKLTTVISQMFQISILITMHMLMLSTH